jgi:ENTS family enterobactin (siderophore) exporter
MPRPFLIDLGPLRRSRDLRALLSGQVVSVLGTQMATVAVPYQVYRLTGSSLDVGLVSLAALGPLLAGSLLGGSIADAVDRRRLLIAVSVLSAAVTAGLAVNASRPSLWPIFLCAPLAAGLGTFEDSALGAVVPPAWPGRCCWPACGRPSAASWPKRSLSPT